MEIVKGVVKRTKEINERISGDSTIKKPKFKVLLEDEAWFCTLPLKLRLIDGRSKLLANIALKGVLLTVFLSVLITSLIKPKTTTYMSLDYPAAGKFDFWDRKIVNCSEVPLLVPEQNLRIDEDGHWSTSHSYNDRKMMKHAVFTSFQGDDVMFDEEIRELNECIDSMNAYFLRNTMYSNLLKMSFKTCVTSSGKTKLSFPIHWPSILDFTYSRIMLKEENITGVNATYSGSPGSRIIQIGQTLIVSVLCDTETNFHSKNLCGWYFKSYTTLSDREYLTNTSLPIQIQLSMQSITRCVAINAGIYDASDTEDMILVEDWNYAYKALLKNTEDPNSMFVLKGNSSLWGSSGSECGILYEDNELFLLLKPTIQYTHIGCEKPCSDPQRPASCGGEWDLDLIFDVNDLLNISQTNHASWGQLKLSARGTKKYINENMYFPIEPYGLSCTSLLQPLPTSNQSRLPFALTESYLRCDKKFFKSYDVALSSAYVSTLICFQVMVGMIMFIALRCTSKPPTGPERYKETEIELAILELAVDRIEQKKGGELRRNSFHSIKERAIGGFQLDSEKNEEDGVELKDLSSYFKKTDRQSKNLLHFEEEWDRIQEPAVDNSAIV
eukprot:CAMPEP_0117793974 /NCGR_PEP_ID=MMETSP0948-20121206/10409_1 /TAXON_ID=44440 /ORGANISM="Chattonella subsalsa, Strain CCMP2191" /LENGTH=611 /DNA_ID=CAMNT_0005624595 /DNA_START=47 /DNA_END=1882 /DNA_ORIENTATION=-